MPYIHVINSLPVAGVDVRSVTRTFLEALAPALKIHEEVVMVRLSLDQALILGDSDEVSEPGHLALSIGEPTVFVEIRDIELLVESVHHAVKVTSETVAQVFGVPAECVYVIVQEGAVVDEPLNSLSKVPLTHWGWQGVTVRKIADAMAANEKACYCHQQQSSHFLFCILASLQVSRTPK